RSQNESASNLPVAAHAIFERGQLLDADRPTRMHLAGGNADFRSHAELTAIGKLRGGIVQENGRVDLVEEPRNRFRIFRHDGFGMMRRIAVDMVNRTRNAID